MTVEAPPSVQLRPSSRSPVRVLWGDLDANDIGASGDVRLPSDAAQERPGRAFMSSLCADQRGDRLLDQGRGASSPVGDRRSGHLRQGTPLYKNDSADNRHFLH